MIAGVRKVIVTVDDQEREDIQQTHAELEARGVRFPASPARMRFGWWSMFEDWEGTRFALGQWGSHP